MPDNDPNKFPALDPDNAPTGPTGSPRQLSAKESDLVSGIAADWFYIQVTYTDNGKTAQGYLSQYVGGAMYWDSYVIITANPQTKFKQEGGGRWVSDVKNITYKNPPFYLCATAGPRFWVYLSNYYTDVRWWIDAGQLYNDHVSGPAGFEPQDPPFYSRQLWVCFNGLHLSDCKIVPA